MSSDSILFRCDSCNTRIVLSGSHVIHSPQPKDRKSLRDDRGIQSGLHEGLCPKCDATFEIWSQPTITSTHTLDLEMNDPGKFVGEASARVEKLRIDRKEEEERREQHRLESEKRRELRETKLVEKAEARQIEVEEQRKASLAARPPDDGDEGDYFDDDGDRTPNDDRSDSMNPNNDAYHASRQ